MNRVTLRRVLSLPGLAIAALLPLATQGHEDLLARIAGLTEQMRTNGVTAQLLLERAEMYRFHQDYTNALRDYDAAAKELADNPQLNQGRALALAGSGRLAESREVFDQLLQYHPTNPAALLGRASVLAQLNKPAEAVADYSRALTNMTNPHPEEFLERARLQAEVSGPAAAAKGLDEGLSRLGWTITLQQCAMEYDLASRNYDSALARLETILSRAHRRESWLELKGEILQKANRPAEAREAFQAALKAISELPPRLANAERTVALRIKTEAALTLLKPAN